MVTLVYDGQDKPGGGPSQTRQTADAPPEKLLAWLMLV